MKRYKFFKNNPEPEEHPRGDWVKHNEYQEDENKTVIALANLGNVLGVELDPSKSNAENIQYCAKRAQQLQDAFEELKKVEKSLRCARDRWVDRAASARARVAELEAEKQG